MCNGEVRNFIMVKKWSSQFYTFNHNVILQRFIIDWKAVFFINICCFIGASFETKHNDSAIFSSCRPNASFTQRTCTGVDACRVADPCARKRTWTYVDVRGRMPLQLHAIVKYYANYAAWSYSKNHARPRTAELDLCVKARAYTYVAAISVSAVIEINVSRLQRERTCAVWV